MPAQVSLLPAAAAASAAVTFEGLEVTQAIQNMPHNVPLVAGKPTVVRVYLGTQSVTPITIRGVLMVKANTPGSTWIQVPSITTVQLNPSENGQLRLKREHLEKSLTFRLPPAATAAGTWTVSLGQLQRVLPTVMNLPVPVGAARIVQYVETPALRVHIIGVRYRDATHGAVQTHEPGAKDFALIHSWLGRAYPVSNVVWSQVNVDSPNGWPFDAATNNAFIRAVRMQDVQHGTDHRTHYFGLVDDAGGANFMRGLASGVPTSAPDPTTVASGPTGANTWGWDFDGSYGDWYTGHELGHTFGRLHAEFCGATGGGPYPFPNGQLSPDDGSYVGFDVGDPAHNLPMQALPGVVWHDVMTYCNFQWLSSFTYIGIRDRIVAESALAAGSPAPASGAMPSAARTTKTGASKAASGRKRAHKSARAAGGVTMARSAGVHVVALVNLTKNAGKIQFVSPIPEVLEAASGGAGAGPAEFTVRFLKQDRSVIQDYPAPFFPDTCTDVSTDKTGIVDVQVPAPRDAVSIELVYNSKVLDSFVAGGKPSPLKDIVVQGGGQAGLALATGTPTNPVISWTDTGASHGGAAGLLDAATNVGPTYIVQLSTDDGQTWKTIGMGLRDPQVTVDRRLLQGASQVMVRVTATNGFQTESTTTTIPADQM
jgi:hypothetical protein